MVICYFRSQGLKAAVYIDDFFNAQQPYALALKNRDFLLYVLHKCGWIVSSSKHGPMSQQEQFLGLIINSITIMFEILEEKLKHFID